MGRDEYWLQKWIVESPARLGLGFLTIVTQELQHYGSKGGRLDILAYRSDLNTYYEIEVMLGECDADHGFRTLDYWARERLKNPNSLHIAVLVAEELSGRYKTVIETLPQFLPFIAIEIRTLRLQHEPALATIFATIVAAPDDVVINSADEPGRSLGTAALKDSEWWQTNSNDTFLKTVRDLVRICAEEVGESRLDYSAQSYIALKKGRRCWLPMWPRRDGCYVYLPSGPGGAADLPSDFFSRIKERLAILGIEPSWTYKYNGGANPIGFAIPSNQALNSLLIEVLREAYQFA